MPGDPRGPGHPASGLYTDIHTWERGLRLLKDAHNDETLEEVEGAPQPLAAPPG